MSRRRFLQQYRKATKDAVEWVREKRRELDRAGADPDESMPMWPIYAVAIAFGVVTVVATIAGFLLSAPPVIQ